MCRLPVAIRLPGGPPQRHCRLARVSLAARSGLASAPWLDRSASMRSLGFWGCRRPELCPQAGRSGSAASRADVMRATTSHGLVNEPDLPLHRKAGRRERPAVRSSRESEQVELRQARTSGGVAVPVDGHINPIGRSALRPCSCRILRRARRPSCPGRSHLTPPQQNPQQSEAEPLTLAYVGLRDLSRRARSGRSACSGS